MPSPYLPYARLLLRGALCFGLAIAAWEAGRWARQRQPSTAAESRVIFLPKPPASPPEESLAMETRLQRLLAQPAGMARRLALMKFRDSVPLSAIPELLASGQLAGVDEYHLAEQWAKHDPAGLFEWALARQEGPSMQYAHVIFGAWAKQDPAAAVSALSRMSPLSDGNVSSSLFDLWAKGDAETAAKLTPYLNVFAQSALGEIRRTARYERDGKLSERILALPASPEKSQLMIHYAAGVFEGDWQKGLSWARQLPADEQPEVLKTLAERAFREKPKPAGEAGQKQPDEDRLAWARRWLAEEADDTMRVRLGPLHVENLSATDPEGALRWAQEWLGGAVLASAVKSVVETQFAKDSEASRALVEELPPGGVRTRAALALAEKWAKDDPAAAVQWARDQDKETMSSQRWGMIGSRWAYDNPEAFKEWVGQAEGVLPDTMIGWGVSNLAQKDMPGTAEWAAALPAVRQQPALRASLNAWSESDPAAASRFVASHPQLPYSENSLNALARRLFTQDADAAIAWARELPTGPGRAAALTSARAAATKEPDPSRREAWLERLK